MSNPSSYPPVDRPRDAVLRLRLTHEERAELVALAERRGRTLSEVVRTSLPLSTNRGLVVERVVITRGGESA